MVSVAEVRQKKTIASGSHAATAEGMFYIVTIRQSSDALRARIGIASPTATVLLADGRRVSPSGAGARAYASIQPKKKRSLFRLGYYFSQALYHTLVFHVTLIVAFIF